MAASLGSKDVQLFSTLHKLNESVNEMMYAESETYNTAYEDKLQHREQEAEHARSEVSNLKEQLYSMHGEATNAYYNLKKEFESQCQEIIELKAKICVFEQENKTYRADSKEKGEKVERLLIEKEERTKKHLKEIEDLKLLHAQEMFILKKTQKTLK
eukprot:CAMPEP_0115031956 /NCGR_PEP_ID=MMETSP0216-20121206/38868_1 /TAXON_ID=223996 /ORGANISM="Protocruzia adherens, Strain Boccale" /LENGTH=156 /DNA_ID=CAMNT_0002409757 /DNA_START=34 /DNA_END=504 /DNA_ORIENTATION=+